MNSIPPGCWSFGRRSNGGATRKRRNSYWALLAFVLALFFAEGTSRAQYNSADADSMLNAYNNAFLNNTPGYWEIATGGMWGEAEQIEGIEDAYVRTGNSATLTEITNLLNGFISQNGSSWSWDSYNDDIMWACIAMMRGYQFTGNKTFLSTAESNFALAWSRGWDPVVGGMYQTTQETYKASCDECPATIVAYMLYQATGTASYLTQAQALYNWEVANLFNTSTGAVADGLQSPGNVNGGQTSYNQGTFVAAAEDMGDITNARLAATNFMNWQFGSEPSLGDLMPDYGEQDNNSAFNSIAIRWIAKLMKDYNLQGTYLSWLQYNANAAWNVRNANNLSWDSWENQTPNQFADAWSCLSSLVALQCVPPPAPYANTYGILNRNSGMGLEASGGGTASGTLLVQYPYSGTSSELWNITPVSNGQYSAIGVQSGLSIGVSGNSTSNNAQLILYPYSHAPDELFTEVNQGGNYYSLEFVNSGLAMSVLGGSASSGADVVQSTPASATNQEWTFQPVLTTGNYALFVYSSDLCLSASGGGTVDNTPLVESPYAGSTSQIWNVTSLGNGQYSAIGVQSGRSINVSGSSTANNAAITLYDYSGASNQIFTLQDASGGNGYDNIVMVNSGLDLCPQAATSGSPIIQYTPNGGPNESWAFQPVTPSLPAGVYSVTVNSTGMCLSATNGGTTAGTHLVQSPFTGGSSQLWNISPVGNGEYSAIGAGSGLSINVSGDSTAANAPLILWGYNGASNELFTLQYENGAGNGYNVIFVNSGLAMAVENASATSGANIVQYTANGATNEQWAFQPYTPLAAGTYSLVVKSTGMCMTASGGGAGSGTSLVQSPFTSGSTDQLWNVTSLGNGQYNAVGVQSGLSINVAGDSTANNAQLILYPYNAATNELFTLQSAAGGTYNIVMVNSGLDLSILAASASAGADVVQYAYVNATNQQWTFQPQPAAVPTGTYAMVVKSTGMALYVSGNGTTEGTALVQSGYNGSSYEQWKVTSLGNGQYEALQAASGLSINVSGNSTTTNAPLILYDYNGATNELFTLQPASASGYFNVVFVNSGLDMSVLNGSTSSGAAAVQATPVANATNQEWTFIPQEYPNP